MFERFPGAGLTGRIDSRLFVRIGVLRIPVRQEIGRVCIGRAEPDQNF